MLRGIIDHGELLWKFPLSQCVETTILRGPLIAALKPLVTAENRTQRPEYPTGAGENEITVPSDSSSRINSNARRVLLEDRCVSMGAVQTNSAKPAGSNSDTISRPRREMLEDSGTRWLRRRKTLLDSPVIATKPLVPMPRRDLLEDNGVSTVHVEGSPTQACR